MQTFISSNRVVLKNKQTQKQTVVEVTAATESDKTANQ